MRFVTTLEIPILSGATSTLQNMTILMPRHWNCIVARMKNRLLILPTLMLGILITALPLYAHHGNAMYDETKLVSVIGIVTSFEFSNPHALVTVEVKDDKGNIQKWLGEGTSPNMLV